MMSGACSPGAGRLAATLALALLAAGGARGAVDPRCEAIPETAAPEPEWHARLCFDEDAAALRPRPSTAGETIDVPISNGYAHDIRVGAGNFVRHRLNDFPGQTVLDVQPLFLTAQDFDPLGETLYALDWDGDRLGTLDLSDGTFTEIGPSVPLGNEMWSGLAVHPLTGALLASATDDDTSSLYTIAPATGTATLVGSTTLAPIIVAIAMNCDGELYAHDLDSDSLYTLDPATGEATLVGPTGVDARFAQGMDFDNSDGRLYAWIYQGSGANQYGTIDPATGAFTPQSMDDPFGEFEGATQTLCFENALLFQDGFESGDTGAWTTTVQ